MVEAKDCIKVDITALFYVFLKKNIRITKNRSNKHTGIKYINLCHTSSSFQRTIHFFFYKIHFIELLVQYACFTVSIYAKLILPNKFYFVHIIKFHTRFLK